MKKLIILVAVVFSLSLCFTGTMSFAQYRSESFRSEFPRAMVGGAYLPRAWNPFEASWLIGYRVWSPISDSFSLGQITNLVIDESNDRIALIILSNAPGFGADRVAVPYGSVIRTGSSNFELNIPSNKIGFNVHWDVYQNKYRSAMAPGVLPKTIDAKWVTNLYKEYEQFPYWIANGEKPLTGFYMSGKLIGAEVETPQKKMLGTVDDLVINSRNGQLVFAIVTCDSGKVAVPYSLLSKKGENTFVLNATESKLVAAPSFNRYEDMGSRAYASDVYRYFGVEPFWRE